MVASLLKSWFNTELFAHLDCLVFTWLLFPPFCPANLWVILTFCALCVEIHFRPKELSSQKLVKTNGSGFNELVCLAQKFCQKKKFPRAGSHFIHDSAS